MSGRARDRHLFVRWCDATGRDPFRIAAADLEEFFRQVPARGSTVRLRRAAAQPALTPSAPTRRLELTVPAIGAAARAPVRAVRDHVVLRLLAEGCSRPSVAAFGIEPGSLAPHAVSGHGSADRCLRCAMSAWATTAQPLLLGHRSAARRAATEVRDLIRSGDHVCTREPPAVPISAIDRHGWAVPGRLSVRSISRIVASNRSNARPDAPIERRAAQPADPADLSDGFAAAEAAMGELEERMAALQAELRDLSGDLDGYR
ncbi:hypothetical protein [Curtobacterium sp. 20TX0008]|uniref:hypothetical protein n=1 Tax=Curtobacterium sp. 20TX0008 TaxID=3022018 RepID=UPI00232C2F58|nr:hypothetical protein [Curtobacterium sp. 20TX0008]MDB6425857.1 hypothetical protein [Curtobacterium sp. 20TX0008]